jgi:hypothetical protein
MQRKIMANSYGNTLGAIQTLVNLNLRPADVASALANSIDPSASDGTGQPPSNFNDWEWGRLG